MAITKHIYQIFIKATPEQVWEAIIEPSWTRRYFHGTAFDSPPVKGEPYRTTLAGGQPAVDGVIEEGNSCERGADERVDDQVEVDVCANFPATLGELQLITHARIFGPDHDSAP